MKAKINKKRLYVVALALVIVTVIGSAAYAYIKLRTENSIQRSEVSKIAESLGIVKADFRRMRDALLNERSVNSDLSRNLQAEQAKNFAFESQIQSIAGTVGTLKKLSETDRELLKKYSKVYFLSENYVPSKLSELDPQYLMHASPIQQFHADAAPFLMQMLSEASESGAALRIVSAYRSFYDQISVKTGYKLLYGSGANQFSADQGYSEHQLGTAVDLTTPKLATFSLQFEKSPEYKWLIENAYRFGFVLSYPRNNSYYQFEPWHWRFVGTALAARLHAENKYFYDLAQRDIDAYLISIFDR